MRIFHPYLVERFGETMDARTSAAGPSGIADIEGSSGEPLVGISKVLQPISMLTVYTLSTVLFFR